MKQHKKPCGTCPFRIDTEPTEKPGGSPLEVYVGQTFLPFQIPCHECIDYDEEDWKENTDDLPQCVGHAMLRKNERLDEIMPQSLVIVDPDDNAFESIQHWWAHHRKISLGEARSELTTGRIVMMCMNEITRTGMRFVKRPAPTTEESDRGSGEGS